MTSDPGQREPRRPRPDFSLPRMISVSTRLTRHDPPARRNFRSQLPQLDQTVEFLVETDGPIPARALGPVLFVGNTPVTEVQVDNDTHYRFIALQPTQLQNGAPITLGWSGDRASRDLDNQDRQDTALRFEAPEGFTFETGQ